MQATSAGHREAGTRGGRLRLVTVLVEPHREEPGDPLLLHGRPEDGVGRRDRTLVVGDHQELGMPRELADDVGEAAHVGFIERRIHFVEEFGQFLLIPSAFLALGVAPAVLDRDFRAATMARLARYANAS